MDTKVWKDQYDAVALRIANEKDKLVTLIKAKANHILTVHGVDNFIGLEASEWSLGLDSQEEHVVAYGDGVTVELDSLHVDDLQEIGDSLYYGNFEIVKF